MGQVGREALLDRLVHVQSRLKGAFMSRERLTAVGESVALLLSKDVLDKLGITVGDEVEVSVLDRTLLLQPLDEADRAQRLVTLTKSVFARRQGAYVRLAKGPE